MGTVSNPQTRKTFLQLVQDAIRESGISQNVPQTTQTNLDKTPRFVQYVKQAYEEIQGERQWLWRIESKEFPLLPGEDTIPTGRTALDTVAYFVDAEKVTATSPFDQDFIFSGPVDITTDLLGDGWDSSAVAPSEANFGVLIGTDYPISLWEMSLGSSFVSTEQIGAEVYTTDVVSGARSGGYLLNKRKARFATDGTTRVLNDRKVNELLYDHVSARYEHAKGNSEFRGTSADGLLKYWTFFKLDATRSDLLTIKPCLPAIEQLVFMKTEADESRYSLIRALPTTSTDEEFNLYGLDFKDDATIRRCHFVPWDQWRGDNRRLDSKDQGRPTYFTLGPDDELIFNRPADKEYGIDMDYTLPIDTMSADSDTHILPVRYQDMIFWRAVMYYAAYDETGPVYTRAFGRYMYYKKRMEEFELPAITFKPKALYRDHY